MSCNGARLMDYWGQGAQRRGVRRGGVREAVGGSLCQGAMVRGALGRQVKEERVIKLCEYEGARVRFRKLSKGDVDCVRVETEWSRGRLGIQLKEEVVNVPWKSEVENVKDDK